MMERERQNLIWNNKLLENRMAVAEQFGETAHLMKILSRDLFGMVEVDRQQQEEFSRRMKKKQIEAGKLWKLEQPDGRIRYYAELRTKGGGCVSAAEAARVLSKLSGSRMVPKAEGKTLEQPDGRIRYYAELRTKGGGCVSAAEAARVLSKLSGSRMVPKAEGKTFIGKEFSLMSFVEEVNFKMIYGAVKITKDKESISGDNYTCATEENGQFFMCLSDGMGSGLEACKESGSIVDTLEQLVEAGFSGETAARMVNSVLNVQNRNGRFSTVDISMVDLYTGVCHFLKAGAATTFIKRDNWVEAISSTSLALGLVQQVDFQTGVCHFLKAGAATTFIKRDNWVEAISSTSLALGLVQQVDFQTTSKKLYEGDFLIMVTDGVLDALPPERAEELMKEIILPQKSCTKEIFSLW